MNRGESMIYLRMLANEADAFELVVAAVLVILVSIAVFFLYRNLAKEFRELKRAKQAMVQRLEGLEDEEEEEDELDTKALKNAGLFTQINEAIKKTTEGQLACLYSIDLDDFRHVHEAYNAKEIQKIDNEIVKRLKKYGGKQAITGHLDEDTFLFYFQGTVDAETMSKIGEDLLGIINDPIKLIDTRLTASIGLVVFPYDGISAEHLYKNAQVAVYVAKKAGKNQMHMFSEDLIDSEQYNVQYYQEIKKSISNDEFLLYYQTIVDVKTGKIIGLESLLRWNHPKKGILPPGKFLNVMELTGDITWFGTWGFEKTVKQYKDWISQARIRDLFISTNLSPKQLETPGLADQFLSITKKYGLSPELFCMEIINFYQILEDKVALKNIDQFRKYGFRIAVDDMGENFRIVSDMQKIPAGIVKLTRNHILHIMDNGENTGYYKRVIKEAIDKSKLVVAEGIETEEMIAEIFNLGIRFMQGYYFNQPKSVIEIEKMVMKSPWNMDSFSHLIEQVEEEE